MHPVDTRTGVRAGQLLGSVGAGSEMAIDAFLIATGHVLGGAMVATVDPDDLRSLAAYATHVTVVNLDG